MKRVPGTHSRRVSVQLGAPLLHGHRPATAKAGGLLGRSSSYLHGEKNGNTFGADDQLAPPRIAIIDGPYDAAALSNVLAREPVNPCSATCAVRPNGACGHGTFIVGLLGARTDAPIPGRCPDCDLVHISLFADEDAAQTRVTDLALAIDEAVASGASLINLSLAVLDDDGRSDDSLAIALDRAEAAGAVVMAAAGNQGRLTASQILSHPVTIPVVAVDAAGNLLPDCNFGPLISRKGVAALGHQLRGYAPDGGTTVMSGTSVATAVATGIVAQVWAMRPNAGADSIRAALTGLGRPEGPAPPRLVADALLVKLDQIFASRTAADRIGPRPGGSSRVKLQGGSAMHSGNGLRRFVDRAAAPSPGSAETVAPAHSGGGCACGGASNGACTCSTAEATRSGLVYVLGTVDCKFPDQCVSHEFQAVVDTLVQEKEKKKKGSGKSITHGDTESVRSWIHRVLTDDPNKPGPRYIARQLCWELTVEGQLAYHLALDDWQDLDDLIKCLGESPDADLVQVAGSSSLIPVEACQGEVAPVLQVAQINAYQPKDFVDWVVTALQAPKAPGGAPPVVPNAPQLAASLLQRLVQAADNFGDEDQWRALNFLAVRYQPAYELYAQKVGSGDYLLDSIRVVPSRLSRERPHERQIVDVVFSYASTKGIGGLEMYFTRVDVTCMFPFIEKPFQRERDRGPFVPNYFNR